MAIIVEDGTVVTGANSYTSTAGLTTFATARGVTLVTDAEQLLIEAMDFLENLGFKGMKSLITQPLQWPRLNVCIDGYYVNSNSIPQQLIDGLCHIAIAIDQDTDFMQDAVRTTTMEKVGDLEIQYSPGSAAAPYNKKIMHVLAKVLDNGSNGGIRVSKA